MVFQLESFKQLFLPKILHCNRINEMRMVCNVFLRGIEGAFEIHIIVVYDLLDVDHALLCETFFEHDANVAIERSTDRWFHSNRQIIDHRSQKERFANEHLLLIEQIECF